MAITNVQCSYDTHVIAGSPANNYESSAQMNVYPGDSIPVLQFNIPNIEEININTAKLFFYISGRGKNINISASLHDVFRSLAGLTYNSYLVYVADYEVLTAEDKYTCPSPSIAGFNQWVSIDITNLVIGHLNQNFYTLVLKSAKISGSSGTSSTTIKSLESGYAPYIQIDYDYSTPFKPTIQYPNGDSVSNVGNLQFLWKYNSGGTTGQKKFDLQWKMQASTAWNNVSQETPNTFYTINASAFTNGIVEWRVRTYNKNNMVSEWATSQFVVIGKPGNPVITGAKNDAITEITWNANKAEESGARIKLLSKGQVIYNSGVIPGGVEDSHIPDIILPNGAYTALLSISNMYDMWSDEVSYAFNIGNSVPAVPDLSVFGNGDYVRLEYSSIPDAEYFIYRSESEGEFEPIARTSKNIYDDYAVRSEVRYQYFVRCYNKAYRDSGIKDVFVKYSGFFLSPVGNMALRINLRYHDSEKFIPVEKKISNSNALILYTGRKKPVKESSIFTSSIVSIEVFVNKSNEKLLEEIYRRNEVFCIRNSDMVMYCDIGAIHETMRFFNKGYLLGLTFSEVDYKERVRFNE